MYLKANYFNYDTFIQGIITELGSQDQVIDDDYFLNLFKGFEKNYKLSKEGLTLEPWQESLVVDLISSVQLTVKCVVEGFEGLDTETPEDEMKKSDHYREVMIKILDNLVEIFTGEDDGSLWYYIENFYDGVYLSGRSGAAGRPDGKIVIPGGIELEPEQFAHFLKDWAHQYLSIELSDSDRILFDHINNNILPREYMKDITVIDVPGTKVKYGDTVITFPLILLEVYDR